MTSRAARLMRVIQQEMQMMAAAEGARFAKDILELVEERDQVEEGGNKKADREAQAEGAKRDVLEGERGCGGRR